MPSTLYPRPFLSYRYLKSLSSLVVGSVSSSYYWCFHREWQLLTDVRVVGSYCDLRVPPSLLSVWRITSNNAFCMTVLIIYVVIQLCFFIHIKFLRDVHVNTFIFIQIITIIFWICPMECLLSNKCWPTLIYHCHIYNY